MKTNKYLILIFIVVSMIASCNIDDEVDAAIDNAVMTARLSKKWKLTTYIGNGTTTITEGTNVTKGTVKLVGSTFINTTMIMNYTGSLRYTTTGDFLLKTTTRLEGSTSDIVKEKTIHFSSTEEMPWRVRANILILNGKKYSIDEFKPPFKMLKLKVNQQNNQWVAGIKTETNYTIKLTFEQIE